MPGNVVRLILLPRYTALFGSMTIYTPPLNVKDFASVILTAWRSVGLGATQGEATFQLQQSTDLGIWEDVGSSFTPASPDAEIAESRDLDLEWVRLKVVVSTSGSHPGCTAWVVGAFVPREKAPE